MSTTTTDRVELTDDLRTVLLAAATREIEVTADNLAHFNEGDDREANIEHMEAAISAYRSLTDGTADAVTIGYVAGLEVSWDASDDDISLPADVQEYDELLERLALQRKLIDLRDNVRERTA